MKVARTVVAQEDEEHGRRYYWAEVICSNCQKWGSRAFEMGVLLHQHVCDNCGLFGTLHIKNPVK